RTRSSKSPGARSPRCRPTHISVFPYMCHLSIRFGKFANAEAKTEFRLHRYERTALLRNLATGVHATARAGADVPRNRGGSENLRENGHGVAKGIGLASPPTRQKTPKGSRVSI